MLLLWEDVDQAGINQTCYYIGVTPETPAEREITNKISKIKDILLIGHSGCNLYSWYFQTPFEKFQTLYEFGTMLSGNW